MSSLLRRALAAALLGAVAGAVCLAVAHSLQPGLVFEMDKPLPSFITGVYSGERDAQATFAWTSGQVVADIPGLDRGAPWSCTLRLRGPRPEGVEAPTVEVLVDDVRATRVPAAGEYHDLGVTIPARTASGLRIVLNIAPTFTPGTADTRVLGVQVDRMACRSAGGVLRPPSRAWQASALAIGLFAAGLALAGLSIGGVLLVALASGAGQAAMMTVGGGVYGGFPITALWLGVGVSGSAAILARLLEAVRRQSLSPAARSVFAVSAVALFLKLIGLMHPAKPIIDALFHAHRLDAVLAGHYFFIQPVGAGGVQMPYAIGLYVFAAPWAWFTTDHVALIRTVTAAADVVAGALLYPVVLRAWGDRRAAALTVLAFQLTPLPFAVLGNANLTNVFGQSVALVTMVAAVAWALDPRRLGQLLAFTLILAWAFSSHVSTVTTLSATLGLLAILYYWRGDAARRRAAISLVLATAAALGFSWLGYYRHFHAVFAAAFARMFSATAEAAPTGATAEAVTGYMTTGERVADLLHQAIGSAGWPLLILACLGAWSVWRRGTLDRLTSALLAWAVVWIVFSAFTVSSKVDKTYVRYVAEFLGRINLATVPLLAILAARGAATGWDAATPAAARRPLQATSLALIAWAAVIAVQAWMLWFQR